MSAVSAALLTTLATNAALDWPTTALTIKAYPKQLTTEAVFAFKNTGDEVSIIKEVAASCDCVQPVLAKEVFAPGESGELRVIFTLGARTGRQEKDITVTMLDDPAEPVVLHLTVDIPESPVRLSASSVVWSQGSVADEKTVDLILTDPEHTMLEGVQCADSAFKVRLESSADAGRRGIVVQPTTTEKLAQAMIRLQARVNGQPRVYLVQAQVR